MKRRLVVLLGVFALIAVSAAPVGARGHQGNAPENFRTHLTGDAEVHDVETQAQGQATFKLSRDGTALHYKLIVANIDDVFMAHIHNAPARSNGPIVVWLYPHPAPLNLMDGLITGRTQGVLAQGTITDGDVLGMSLAELVEEMRRGNTYVNVHTLAFGPGEIRGQIR